MVLGAKEKRLSSDGKVPFYMIYAQVIMYVSTMSKLEMGR